MSWGKSRSRNPLIRRQVMFEIILIAVLAAFAIGGATHSKKGTG
jgi:hypothetical protein